VAELLRIGLGRGRVLDRTRVLFQRAGIDLSALDEDPRRLIHPITLPDIGPAEVVVVRDADVAVYVEHGVCALGVAGYDTIAEQRPNVLLPLDLQIGKCRLCLCAAESVDPLKLESPRIATKYPHLASQYFLERGSPAEIIALSGAIELAPLVGLSDAIVDIVETGETLRRNGLVEKATILEISARLVVNRAALKLNSEAIRSLEKRLKEALA
jgi:ATP phosphoribosyltransferase